MPKVDAELGDSDADLSNRCLGYPTRCVHRDVHGALKFELSAAYTLSQVCPRLFLRSVRLLVLLHLPQLPRSCRLPPVQGTQDLIRLGSQQSIWKPHLAAVPQEQPVLPVNPVQAIAPPGSQQLPRSCRLPPVQGTQDLIRLGSQQSIWKPHLAAVPQEQPVLPVNPVQAIAPPASQLLLGKDVYAGHPESPQIWHLQPQYLYAHSSVQRGQQSKHHMMTMSCWTGFAEAGSSLLLNKSGWHTCSPLLQQPF